VASRLIQQLFNILQAANIEAVRIEEAGGNCKSLVRSLLFADGATFDGGPILTTPSFYLGDYLVYYKTPGGESALLTRAQVEVIMECIDRNDADRAVPGTVAPLGCCTYLDGTSSNNMTQSACLNQPNHQSWCQGPCPSYGGRPTTAAS
jgi:hypothetical protein